MSVALFISEPGRIRGLLIEQTTVLEFSVKVPASDGSDLLTYLATSEWVLLVGGVLIALVLVARKPKEH